MWLIFRGKWQITGQIIFNFGLLFFGLGLISQAVEPLKNSPAFLNLFTQTQNPFLGIGWELSLRVLSRFAIPISIMALLAQQDLVSLENALPVIMGANIGTTVTALLVGTVATVSGKRTAVSHLIFKCIGVSLSLILMPYFLVILKNLSPALLSKLFWLTFYLILLLFLCLFFFCVLLPA